MDRLINAAIFLVTLALVILTFRRRGKWSFDNARKSFRFFTVQSNAFCAAAALIMCVSPQSRAAWLLKYVGTAAVASPC